ILLNVLLIADFEFIIRNLNALANLFLVQKAVFHTTSFGNGVAALVLFVVGLDRQIVQRNFGLQVLRLDQGVIEFHFFVLVPELLRQFIGTDTDAVSDQTAKFFLKQALTDQVFKHRNRHLEALLDLRGVLFHADRAVTAKRCRKELLYAVSDFFVR